MGHAATVTSGDETETDDAEGVVLSAGRHPHTVTAPGVTKTRVDAHTGHVTLPVTVRGDGSVGPDTRTHGSGTVRLTSDRLGLTHTIRP